jgi:hypothetical protein
MLPPSIIIRLNPRNNQETKRMAGAIRKRCSKGGPLEQRKAKHIRWGFALETILGSSTFDVEFPNFLLGTKPGREQKLTKGLNLSMPRTVKHNDLRGSDSCIFHPQKKSLSQGQRRVLWMKYARLTQTSKFHSQR